MTHASSPNPTDLTALEDRYVLFQLRGDRRLRRLTLPVTIGTSGTCDVVLNLPSAVPLAYVLHSRDAQLMCFSVRSGAHQPLTSLQPLGIRIWGAAVGAGPSDSVAVPLKRRLIEMGLLEAAFFAMWPETLRRFIGGGLRQSVRIGAWLLAVVTIFCLGALMFRDAPHPDRSREAVALTFGIPYLPIVGSSPIRRGYEQGARFLFEAPPETKDQAVLLSFKTTALNLPREITIAVNGKDVFASDVDQSCIEAICSKQIPLSPGIVHPGPNELTVAHRVRDSSYMMQDIVVQLLPPLLPEERELNTRWLELARRFYDERGIVADNLLAARIHVERSIDLLSRRADTTDQIAVAKVMLGEIETAFRKEVHDLWATVELHERLSRPEETRRALELLLRLFPDPASAEHRTIKDKLESLKEQTP